MDEKERAIWKRAFTIGPMLFVLIFWVSIATWAILGRLTAEAVLIFGGCSTAFFILIILETAWDLSNKKDEQKWIKCSKCMGTGKVLAETQLFKEEQDSK